jgi:AraC family transcriptional regulator
MASGSARGISMPESSVPDTEVTPGTRHLMAPWQARCVQAYIAAHLHSTIRVADLARVLECSPNRFGRVFRNTFDCAPHQYVMRMRIARARNLLLMSDDTLEEIAAQCGLVNKSHLANLFRKRMGQPPGQWRRVHLAGADSGLEGRVS